MNKRVVLGGILAISAFFALNSSAVTFADNSTDFSITTASVLQLEVPSSASLLLNPTSSAGDFNSTTITAIVSTNSMLGYTLTVSPTNTAETTDLIGSGTNMPALASSDDGYTESTFTANKWGYRLSNNSNYFGMPRTLAPEAWDTSGPTNETDHNLTLAAKVDGSFPAGSYATTLNFELVAKRNELDWEDIAPSCTTHPEKCDSVTGKVAIQSIDEEVCNAVEVFDSQYQVTDLRDHKNYWISKLKDGNCWMTQNLDLDITSGIALTNILTDIGWNGSGYDTASWTPNKTTYKLATSEGDQWQQSGPPGSDAFSMDPGDWYEKSDYEPPTSAEACNYPFDSANCTNIISNTVDDTKGTHGHIGNYYTWSAAVASNNTYTSSGNIGVTTDSICPTNWRLPAVKDDNNDFSNINRLYNDDSSVTDSKLTQAPVYSTRNGYVLSTPVYFGTLETYWSNEDANSGVAYLFFANPGGVQTKYASFHKTAGFAIRCVGRKTNYVTISFNANGGTGTMPAQRIPGGISSRLSASLFTREGYYFNGWNTQADGNGTVYRDEDSITLGSKDDINITLYAQWTTTPPICTEDCDGDNPKYESGITIQRAYELAYTEHRLGMYEEQHEGQGDYARVNSWPPENEPYKGYDVRFAMQDIYLTFRGTKVCDLVTVIGDQYQALDIRDNKLYFISKLADGKCWMTQNLDHNIVAEEGYYTHDNTDLGWGTDRTTTTWTPARATIPTSKIRASGIIEDWVDDDNTPYSVDVGDWYWTDTWHESNDSIIDFLAGRLGNPARFKKNEPFPGNGVHGHVGNYYNWSAAVASNDVSSYLTSTYDDTTNNPQNSICPAGWRLPTIYNSDTDTRNEFRYLLNQSGTYVPGGNERDKGLVEAPLYLVRAGDAVTNGQLYYADYTGSYWSSTVATGTIHDNKAYTNAYSSMSYSGGVNMYGTDDSNGLPVRCISR